MNRLSKISLLVVLPFGLAACQSMLPTNEPGTWPVPRVPGVPNPVGALILDASGRIVVANPDGTLVQACQLPPRPQYEKGTTAAGTQQPTPVRGELPICSKLIDTTVFGVTSITVIRHTGSECWSVIPAFDGRGGVYALPPGCTKK
jgi:hypothetical protein